MPPVESGKGWTQKGKGLEIRTKLLLFVVLINVAFTLIFSIYGYQARKSWIMRDIDSRLLSSAHAIRYILPDGFHEKIHSEAAVPVPEHVMNVRRLSAYAKSTGMTYLYTMMKSGDRIVFTSASATDDELQKGSFDPFYTVYENAAPSLVQAFHDHKVFYEESHDKYGDFRTVIVPVVLDSGRVYVMGADLDIRFIQAQLRPVLVETLLIGLVLSIATLGFASLILKGFGASLAGVKEQLGRIVETGELTGTLKVVPRDDEAGEISRRINSLMGIVRGVAARMRDASGTIMATSSDIVSQTETLAFHAQDQYDVMSETSRNLEDLGTALRRSGEEAVCVESEMKAFLDAAQERMGLVNAMSESMRQIDISCSRMEPLKGAIKEIAYQADLLALNALVEAERAGGYGNGFLVVAQEMGNLARKAEEAARDVEQALLENLEATGNGLEVVAEVSDYFGEIINKLSGINEMISHMKEISLEQGDGIRYLEEAVSRARDILEHHTDIAGTIAESSHELRAELDILNNIIESIKGR